MLKKNQQQPQLDSQIDIKTTKANMQRENYNNHSNKLSHCVCVCVRVCKCVRERVSICKKKVKEMEVRKARQAKIEVEK